MKKGNASPENLPDLRYRAEQRLKRVDGKGEALTLEESQRLVHELQVHQIELEMQNEELRRTKEELEAALSKYTDLYDSSPVSYFTLGRDGTIRSVNLTGAHLLGVERSRLLDRRLGLFISAEFRSV